MSGKPWSSDHKAMIWYGIEQGLTYDDLALMTGRTKAACKRMAEELGAQWPRSAGPRPVLRRPSRALMPGDAAVVAPTSRVGEPSGALACSDNGGSPLPSTCLFPRWAHGDKPDNQFCGAPRDPRSPSYCTHHHELCYVAAKPYSEGYIAKLAGYRGNGWAGLQHKKNFVRVSGGGMKRVER